MANISAQLILSGAGMSSDAFAYNKSATLSIGNPTVESGALSLVKNTTASAVVPTGSAVRYMYVANTGTTAAGGTVKIAVNSGAEFGELAPGEFCFVPIKGGVANIDITETGNVYAATIEYAFFTKA